MSFRASFVLVASLACSAAACSPVRDDPDGSSFDARPTVDGARTDTPTRDAAGPLDASPPLDALASDDTVPPFDAPTPRDSYLPPDVPAVTDVPSPPDARDAAPPRDVATDARTATDGGASCAANTPCDPLTQAGCGPGETCYPVYQSAYYTETACLPTGHGAPVQSCDTDNGCLPGYTCMLHLVCMRLCDPGRGGLHSSECTGSTSGGPDCDRIPTGAHGPDSCFGICQNGYTGG